MKLSPTECSAIIAAACEASLKMACIPPHIDLDALCRAIGNNATQAIIMVEDDSDEDDSDEPPTTPW
jgi:hypothetical protein